MHNLFLFNLTSDGKEMTKTLKTLHNYTDKVIAERKLSRKKALQEKVEETDEFGRKKRLAFLDLLLEEAEKSNAFTDKDIREETDTFIFAVSSNPGVILKKINNFSFFVKGSRYHNSNNSLGTFLTRSPP